jgi:hypothetical protein
MSDATEQPAMEPVRVTIVGGTGSGNSSTQTIVTPAGQRNIIATFVPTALALLVGWVDTFLTVFLAVSGIGAVSSIDAVKSLIPTHAALGGAVMEEAIFYAFTAATFALLKDIAVIVSKLKQKFPLLGV